MRTVATVGWIGLIVASLGCSASDGQSGEKKDAKPAAKPSNAPTDSDESAVRFRHTFKLDPIGKPGTIFTASPPKHDQTVKIEITAKEAIDVEVVLVQKLGKKSEITRTKVKSFDEKVKIPANIEFEIRINLAAESGAADVLVEINSVK